MADEFKVFCRRQKAFTLPKAGLRDSLTFAALQLEESGIVTFVQFLEVSEVIVANYMENGVVLFEQAPLPLQGALIARGYQPKTFGGTTSCFFRDCLKK